MALTQNRLLLLCEAIPDSLEDMLMPTPTNSIMYMAHRNAGSSEDGSFSGRSNSSDSVSTSTGCEATQGSPKVTKPTFEADDDQMRISFNSMPAQENNFTFSGLPSFHSPRLERVESSTPPSSCGYTTSGATNGASSTLTLNSSSGDRDCDSVSPASVPNLIIVRSNGGVTHSNGSSTARMQSVTGKRKAVTQHVDKAMPVKLSRKLGAGFIVCSLTSHFNAGDTEKLRETITQHATEDCHFHVKSIAKPAAGNKFISSFLCSFLDALPDTYIITANETVLDEFTLKMSIKFRGTKLRKSESASHFMKEHLVDNMNVARMSEEEISSLRAQETALLAAQAPIELVFQGTMTVGFNEKIFDNRRRSLIDFSRVTGKMNSFIMDYELKSFKDASVVDPSAV